MVTSQCPAVVKSVIRNLAFLLVFVFALSGYLYAQQSVGGSWDEPVQLEVDGVHGIVLPNGKVLYLPHREDPVTGQTLSAVFDPDDPAGVNYVPASRNYFCGGHSLLADGRAFFNGGDYNALSSSGYFDYRTETWTIVANTNRPRWYPSTIQLGDGSLWTFGGQNSPANVETNDPTIEIYDVANDTWTMAGGQGIPRQYFEHTIDFTYCLMVEFFNRVMTPIHSFMIPWQEPGNSSLQPTTGCREAMELPFAYKMVES